MANASPTPPGRPMSVWQKFIRLTVANQVAVITAIVAMVISFTGLGVTLHYSQKQAALDASVATFQAQVQTTAVFQSSQQISMQQTQTVLNEQVQSLAVQQAYPLVVIIPSAPAIEIDKVIFAKASDANFIIGTGYVQLILANNGGGKASFYDVTWDATQTATGVLDTVIENSNEKLPLALEGQTPIKLRINLNISIYTSQDLSGKNEIELANIWTNALKSSSPQILLKFTNTDTLSFPTTNIVLHMAQPVADGEVNAVASKIFCPVCENTPLDACSTELCQQWRGIVRDMLSEGKTEEEILQFFKDNFGARILAKPPTIFNDQINTVAGLIAILTVLGFLIAPAQEWVRSKLFGNKKSIEKNNLKKE